MPNDTQKLKDSLRRKDREIKELKALLAESETELKEYSSADNMIRPRASILESKFLNKAIKLTFFILLCAVIVMGGLYPWLFKDKILGDDASEVRNEESVVDEQKDDNKDVIEDKKEESKSEESTSENTTKDIFKPTQLAEVASDLGWLNVRTEPNIENGKIIKKINSGEDFEWVEKTDDNWYKLVIDDEGHTGYVSGEYIIEK